MNRAELAAATLVYMDTLYNLATWLVDDPADASALLQETYRRALDTLPRDLSGTKLRVRLLTMMWGIYRQRRAPKTDGFSKGIEERGRSGNPTAPTPPHEPALGMRGMLHTFSRGDLDAALRRLPEELRAAIILADLEGYPLVEVAEVLSWSGQQVQGMLSQARQLLHSFLQERLASTPLPLPPEAEGTL